MEKIMQYAWQWRLYGNKDLRLVDGRKIRIIDPGTLNKADGPDFFNAKIYLDGFELVGNVEIHVKASDWWRHNHHLDPSYSNIILHVVAVDDAQLTKSNGLIVPQLLFPLSPQLIELYSNLSADASLPPPMRCWHRLQELPPILLQDAIYSASFERIREKSSRIIETLRYLDGDISHTCIVAIARALGFGVNSQPFEQTALKLNLNHCARHADDTMQLDALVFGTAGLLSRLPKNADPYFYTLQSEFNFLSHKYSITALPPEIWKRSGVRPQNSPYRRLAYLARLLPHANSLMSRLEDAQCTIEKVAESLDMEFTDYWADHYTFGNSSPNVPKNALKDSSLQLLLINAIAPLTFAMGMIRGQVAQEEMAADLLTNLPPENNSITRDWIRVGIKPKNAFESQGLIQLRKQYCDCNKCLQCRIGNRLLRSQALPVLPVPRKTSATPAST